MTAAGRQKIIARLHAGERDADASGMPTVAAVLRRNRRRLENPNNTMTLTIIETEQADADGSRHYELKRSDAHVLTLKHDPRHGIPDLLRSAAAALMRYDHEQKMLTVQERALESLRAKERRALKRAKDRAEKKKITRPRTWHLNLPSPGKWTPREAAPAPPPLPVAAVSAIVTPPPPVPPPPVKEPEPEETEARHPLSLRKPKIITRSMLAMQARAFLESGMKLSEIVGLVAGAETVKDVKKLISEAKP